MEYKKLKEQIHKEKALSIIYKNEIETLLSRLKEIKVEQKLNFKRITELKNLMEIYT